KSYWSFSLTEKVDAHLELPKELMKFLLYGTPNIDNNLYNLQNFGIDMSAYTEAALGYSRILNDKWSVGAKLKFLYGTANVATNNESLNLKAGINQWTLTGQGTINSSSPIKINGNNFQSVTSDFPSTISDWVKPYGLGAGFDLGVAYKPMNNLTLTAAITDLGMIKWNKNIKNIGYKIDYKFNGLDSLTLNNSSDINQLKDSLVTAFKNSVKDSISTGKAYKTYTSPKLNIGGEWGFYENKLSLGLLSRTMFANSVPYEELTASVNGRPIDWFNMSISYSFFNGRLSNIGTGIGLRTGFVHWFLSADYIPLSYSPFPLDKISSSLPTSSLPIPYNTKGVNFAIGINFEFGNRKDADRDGVVDRKDKCPDTPFGVIVDKKGCPVDTDGDGVPDYLDKCANTPPEAYSSIDLNGCPKDTDGDSIPDYLDKCPDTPKAAIGFVDKKGCPTDTDGDGVPDYLDKCKETPSGVQVDSIGCPIDSDKDGVPDYLDKCPDTPIEAKGLVDKNGCPLDSDGDGVPDYLDLCPDTPKAAIKFVDKNGCTVDNYGVGIPDNLKKHPDTQLDTDGDGIPDYLDKCPTIPGVLSNNGCPEIKKEIKTLFKKALQGIQFESGNDLIKDRSFTILNQIAGVMIANPTYLIEIRGHTDNDGNPESNLVLSKKRAIAVLKYLKKKGVPKNRMIANGYGDKLPISSNLNSVGKQLNRRVEFEVSFEEITLH
ncbi:MAG: DUF5723 family protein, partial [Bacteroidota bacterium]|nr:DUF5723 family protein [Bacteroidota bacterium]